MNPEVKEKWLTALRSGEYRQGMGSLRRGDEFCCLGVLCDLAVKEGEVGQSSDSDGVFYYDYTSEGNVLPYEVCVWAGLSGAGSTNPWTTEKAQGGTGPYLSLAQLNDQGRTFAEIADIIERDL